MDGVVISRRRWLRRVTFAAPVLGVADAAVIEPQWLKVATFKRGQGEVRQRCVHVTDIHFKGDRAYLEKVVDTVNRLEPDLICFTGELVEDSEFVSPALEILGGLRAPVYGVPGNHDHWSGADFSAIDGQFRKRGGRWLQDEAVDLLGGRLRIIGADEMPLRVEPSHSAWNLLMVHYPQWADLLDGRRFDLILAGHTHGGQVRLPGIGAMITPFLTGDYELGSYDTPGGPLYVNAGIGTFYVDLRFNCRPEITVFELCW